MAICKMPCPDAKHGYQNNLFWHFEVLFSFVCQKKTVPLRRLFWRIGGGLPLFCVENKSKYKKI